MENEPGSWRWVVLAAAFFNLIVNSSVNYMMGVLYAAIIDVYDSDVILTSWLLALFGSLYALAAPIGSFVVNMWSCRTCVFLSGLVSFIGFVSSCFVTRMEWFFLTLTVTGIGQSMSQVGGTVILAFYFPTMAAIANGICLAGSGLGSFIHPPLMQALLDQYGLKGAFLILAGISLNSCVAALTFRPTSKEITRKRTNHPTSSGFKALLQRPTSVLEILKLPEFTSVLLATFFFSIAFQSSIMYLPEYLITETGIGIMEASVVVGVMGGSSVGGRLLAGFAASDPDIGETIMLAGMNGVASFMCLFSSLWFSFHIGIYIFSAAFGVYASATQALFSAIVFAILGFEKTATGLGIMLMTVGVGSLIGPPLLSLLVVQYGYSIMFYVCGGFFGAAFIFYIFSALAHKPDIKQELSTLGTDLEKVSLHNSVSTLKSIHTVKSLNLGSAPLLNELFNYDIVISEPEETRA